MEKYKRVAKNKLNDLPTTSGVYLFYAKREIIYIGKAVNIKDRVKNHFLQPTYKDNFFVSKTTKIGFIETDSEIEALVLEANLIKKHQPKFNSVWRDDKNYFYVAITPGHKFPPASHDTLFLQAYKNRVSLPYVFITHQKNDLRITYIGPFTEGTALKKTLKFLRRVFPYYTSARHPKNKCTWCHLGLCPGPLLRQGFEGQANPDLVEYKKNIKKLTLILQGKRKTVLYSLKKEMQALSTKQDFEKAREIRDKLHALEQVMAHVHVIENQKWAVRNAQWDKTQTILQGILNDKAPISQIECFDISNIQGKQAVGSMVVFVDGAPTPSQYKKFRIRMKNEPNDIAMLKEVLSRRLAHPEWDYPQVMLIDGGIAQLNIAIKTKKEYSIFLERSKNALYAKNINRIKIISIAKGRRELFIEPASSAGRGRKQPIPLKDLPQEIYNLIVHLDDEAHRFAISYHKKLRKKNILKN